MPSGWSVYYVVFLSAALGLGVFVMLGVVFRRRPGASAREGAFSRSTLPSKLGDRINTRYFLAANSALVLITLMLVLIPCVCALRAGNEKLMVLRGLIAVISVAGFAALGLLYSARKGDLSWLRTFRRDE